MEILKPEFEHKDKRRSLKQLFTADIKQVNYYSNCKKGSILGLHYHKKTTERFLVARGKVYDGLNVFKKGDCFLVRPPEYHALKCLTNVDLVSFLDRPYTKEKPDIWKD